jgi:hypothetical protein
MEETVILDAELFRLTRDAVKDGLAYVKYRQEKGGYIGHYYNFPTLSWRENGLPSFSTAPIGSGPLDYKDAFGGLGLLGRMPFATYEEFDKDNTASWKAVYEYFSKIEVLRERSFFHNKEMSRVSVHLYIERLIDRYIHVYARLDFDENDFLLIYKPIEEGLLSDKLTINILVPILMLGLDENEISLDDGAKIIRMSDSIQLARAPDRGFSYGRHPLVESAATHALLLSDYWLPNTSVYSHYLDRTGYPRQTIDSFFAAIRMITSHKTGYARLITQPVAWTATYEANLPPLDLVSVREYPISFEDGCWNEEVPTLLSDAAKESGRLFRSLEQLSSERSKFGFAVKRFNLAHLRETDEDTTVDAAIGMEALLSDSNEEMTHKLAMRVAALSTLEGRSDPVEIMRDVKQIYGFRSSIVHGDMNKIEKRREVVKAGNKISTAALALSTLGMVLRALARNPAYLADVTAIDKDMLLGKFPLKDVP